MAQVQSTNNDGLPKSFVSAMRTLFHIMDDQNTGFVKYSDIEERWQDDGTRGMPKGVLDSLKRVTPPNGLLTFDRFCAGLKICLVQTKKDPDPNSSATNGHDNHDLQPNRPPSAPILINENPRKAPWTSPNTAAIRPNNANAISQQRTLSMPQLLASGRKSQDNNNHSLYHHQHHHDNNIGGSVNPNPNPTSPNCNQNHSSSNTNSSNSSNFNSNNHQVPLETIDPRSYGPDSGTKLIKPFGPPKPPRTGASSFDKSEIRTALQNWQMGLMMNSEEKSLDKARQSMPSSVRPQRLLGDGKSVEMPARQIVSNPQKKMITNRRREPRRHTLQNGIDYNMVKRMKVIEQEKDILMQGLAAIDKARDWYLKQISIAQEKIKQLGTMGSHMEQWTESQQERLELQRARVVEVNRHLAALITSWDRGGFPLHMNLAFLNTPHSVHSNHDMLNRLKQQNHRLTEEVGKKSHKIALLEQEKDGLIRELYNRQAGMIQSRRSTMIHEQHDQTFII